MRPTPPRAGSRPGAPYPLNPAPLSTLRFTLALALLLAALALVLCPQLEAPPLTRAEVYFVDAARAMVESGDWLIPRYQGRPFFDKPILSYWLMAACMKIAGTTPGAARLVPLTASLLVVLATAWLGSLIFGRRTALAGAVVLSTTLAFLAFSRVAMSDMLLTLWTTSAFALGVRACRAPAAGWAVAMLGAALGLGFATKGPIAVFVPGVALLLLAWQQRGQPRPFGFGAVAAGAGLFAALGLGWFAALYHRAGSEPLTYFFLRENLQRFAADTYDVGRPAWFYLPAYLAEGLPWSCFLGIALWRLLGEGDGLGSTRRNTLLLATCVAVTLVPLSLSRGKIDYYLLPLFPAISLLIGKYFADIEWRRADVRWARVVLLAAALAAAAFLLAPPRLPEAWLPGSAARAVLVGTLAACAIALLVVSVRPTPLRTLGVLAATVAAVFLLLVAAFLPAFSRAQPNHAIAADVARERRYQPRARLAYCSDPSRARRDVLFEARHTGVEQSDLWSLAGSREPYLLLATPAQDASFQVLPDYRRIASYLYLPADTLTLGGLFKKAEPGELVLCANFKTGDPEAERKRKREYRKEMQKAYAGIASP